MEIRVLQYFLAVAKEESITKAAESLHLSQPTLSRQLMDLEDRLGKTLMIRGSKKISLTEEGWLLHKRAQEIVELAQRTESEIRQSDDHIAGEIWIGGGETEGMRYIARTVRSLQNEHPHVRFNLFSGNTMEVTERLENGLIDFGVGIGSDNLKRYDFIQLPVVHYAGLLMRKDSPLASRAIIRPDDLRKIPIIAPRNEGVRRAYSKWMGRSFDTLNVVATFNLIYNAAFLVEEGMGYALCIDRLVTLTDEHPLCFTLYDPPMEFTIDIAWKKNQAHSKASRKFLEKLYENMCHTNTSDRSTLKPPSILIGTDSFSV